MHGPGTLSLGLRDLAVDARGVRARGEGEGEGESVSVSEAEDTLKDLYYY